MPVIASVDSVLGQLEALVANDISAFNDEVNNAGIGNRRGCDVTLDARFPIQFWGLFGTDLIVRTAYQIGKTPVSVCGRNRS